MENKILPIFTSHYSFGRSILTLDKPEKILEDSPVSIFSIAKTHKLGEIYLVESNMSGFVEAFQNAEENKIALRFGLKLTVCENIDDKSDKSFKTESKIIIWLKNSAGYKDLVRIYSKAATDGFYYLPRISWNLLNEMWSDNLILSIPFYDSFIHKNLLENGNCIPTLKIKPNVFIANMEIPFDHVLIPKYQRYAKQNNLEIMECHLVYYYKDSDFKPYTVFRAINNRSTFIKPEIDFFCSNMFSFESYLRKIS